MAFDRPFSEPSLPPISREIWEAKYRFKVPAGRVGGDLVSDESIADTFARVANAAASVEKGGKRKRAGWAKTFSDAMSDFGFLPGGRILAGAGTGRSVTLFNCFVMGRIGDDLSAIFEQVREAALTMQAGGGIGHDFSTLRPRGALVRSIGADASGPVSFMDVWDSMCRTIMSAGARRGAMMATLRCDHPDIEEFIAAKSDPARLRNFNLSVLVTDPFMSAVRDGAPWDLQFEGNVYRTIGARELWDRLMRSAYDTAEPGVIFIDRINARNNLNYCENIHTTNPCGEQPLPEYGACLLGSINLAALVRQPFTAAASVDVAALEERVATAIRFLDNIIDVSAYPLAAQKDEARAKRRIGLGVTGLADALIMMGERYGTPSSCRMAADWMRQIQTSAYLASSELAREKGAFPLFDKKKFVRQPNVEVLDQNVRDAISAHGIRNGCLTSIAPTGTISLLAGNVSSGIEPVFDFVFNRRVREADGATRIEMVEDFAHAAYRSAFPDAGGLPGAGALPGAFVRMVDLLPSDHLAMQAALQPYVDSAISKTINCPEGLSFEAFRDVYREAYALGLKGCTAYRPNLVTGAVLSAVEPDPPSVAVEVALNSAPAATSDEALAASSSAGQASPPLATGSEAAVSVVPPSRHPLLADTTGDVVYMTKPLSRAGVLEGATYKLKWSDSDHAIYITINDMPFDVPSANGGVTTRKRPFEIFINSGNLEHYAWTVALTRMISAVFRRGGDVSFVADELKAIFDPQGGRWVDGRYVPSLLAAIGEVIETHMIKTGFWSGGDDVVARQALAPVNVANYGEAGAPGNGERQSKPRLSASQPRSCPRCGSGQYSLQEGCWICKSCGFSRCG